MTVEQFNKWDTEQDIKCYRTIKHMVRMSEQEQRDCGYRSPEQMLREIRKLVDVRQRESEQQAEFVDI